MPEKILEVRRQIDDEVRLGPGCEPVGIGARRHQPVVQPDLARRQMPDKGAVEPHQPVAVVKIGEGKPMPQGEPAHTV